jgi:hypothetical protein
MKSRNFESKDEFLKTHLSKGATLAMINVFLERAIDPLDEEHVVGCYDSNGFRTRLVTGDGNRNSLLRAEISTPYDFSFSLDCVNLWIILMCCGQELTFNSCKSCGRNFSELNGEPILRSWLLGGDEFFSFWACDAGLNPLNAVIATDYCLEFVKHLCLTIQNDCHQNPVNVIAQAKSLFGELVL